MHKYKILFCRSIVPVALWGVILASAVFLTACGARSGSNANPSSIVQNVFETKEADPCVKVVFPGIVRQEMVQYSNDGAESVVRYLLRLQNDPHYDFTLMKVYNSGANVEWALVPLTDQYSSEEKLYEINGSDLYFGRSAVVVFLERESGMYLRGIIGEYTDSNRAVFFMIDRMIHRSDYMRIFNREEWLKTSSGKFFVDDMRKQTDWYFDNIAVTGCKPDSSARPILSQ